MAGYVVQNILRLYHVARKVVLETAFGKNRMTCIDNSFIYFRIQGRIRQFIQSNRRIFKSFPITGAGIFLLWAEGVHFYLLPRNVHRGPFYLAKKLAAMKHTHFLLKNCRCANVL